MIHSVVVDARASGIPLGDLAAIFVGMVLSKLPQGELSTSPVRIINSRDIGDTGLAVPEQLDQVELPLTSQNERYQVRQGDVLISARGIFKVARARAEHSGSIAGPNLVVIRSGPRVESWLVYSFLRNPIVQATIQRRSVKTTVASINVDTIANLRISLPDSSRQRQLAQLIELAEQQYILGLKIAESRRVLGHEFAARELID